MNRNHIIKISLTLIAAFTISGTAFASECSVKKIAELPVSGHDGLAGAFYGTAGNKLIIAGGSDFTAKKPWEGGTKQYFDDIYTIEYIDGSYKCKLADTKLPVPLAHGCSTDSRNEILCFGGSTGKRRSSAVYSIKANGNGITVDSIAALPEGFAPSAAASYGDDVFIHGTRDRSNVFYKFSIISRQWKELSACPGNLISEGASLVFQHNGREDAGYLIGGRSETDNCFFISSEIWEYLPGHNSWQKKIDMTDHGQPYPLMYASAIAYGASHILVFGGDDGKEFLKREKLDHEITTCYDRHLKDSLICELKKAFIGHPGFSEKIYAFHTITGTWTRLECQDTRFPVATKAIQFNNRIIIPSGEIAPGRRTNAVYEITEKDEVSFGWLNYSVIVLYLLGMMGVGFYCSKKAQSTDQFFKGGRNIPWWAAGISIFATALSAITFLSIPAKAYMSDWSMFMFNMAILLIVPVVIRFYLPFFRKLKVASAYEYLEQRFSSKVRYLASLFFCLFMFARIAIVLFLPSLALNAVTGINVYVCILLMGLVTIAYCTMGGIEAVVWGDVIQGIILVGGAVVSLIYIITGIDGGLGSIMEIAIEDHKFNILDFSLDLTKPVFWVTLIGGIANQLLTYTSDQSVIQRYITVKDTAGTKRGLWLNGILSVPIAIIFFSIGTGLYVFFKTHPDMLNVGMENTDSIFPHFIMCRLPVGIAGLLIAAVFAAAMSTLSANINSTSTVMTEDFFARIVKDASDQNKMKFARWTGVIVGGLGVIMAILLATFDIASLWDQFNFFLGLLTSGLGGLFMMGIFTERIGTRSALTGFAISFIVLILFNNFSNISFVLYGAIGLASCFIAGWLSSFIYGYRK